MIYEIQHSNANTSNDKNNNNNDYLDLKRHLNISLNGLLKWYLNIDNFVKDEVRILMQKDVYYWFKVI